MIGDKTDSEEKEDEEGLAGSSGVTESVGQVRFLLRCSQKLEGNLPVRQHQGDQYEPEDNQQEDVDVCFPLGMMELLVVKAPATTKHV